MAKKINYAAMFNLRKDGRYQGYWHDPDGKRHTICDRDPEVLYRKIQSKESPPPLTFRNIAEMWHDKHWDEIKGGTKSCYEAPYRRAVELFGDRYVNDVQPTDIFAHLNALSEQDYASKTIKTQRTIYKLIYQNAKLDEKIGKEIPPNPALSVPLPTKMKKPVTREAPEDSIVDKIKANATSAYWGLFAMFLICTGFRKGEALSIRWADIDFKNERISVTCSITHRTGVAQVSDTKTEAGVRWVPLLKPLKEILSKPENAKETDYVFFGEDPSVPLPQSTYNRRWMHYCKDQGFVSDNPEIRVSKQGKRYVKHNYKTTITAHVLRHGYATMLYDAGVDVHTAKELLGHANVKTTISVYTHLSQRKKQESIDKLKSFSIALR